MTDTSMFTLKAGCYPGFGNGGVKIEDFFLFRGSKVSYPINKNVHSNLTYIDIAKQSTLFYIIK